MDRLKDAKNTEWKNSACFSLANRSGIKCGSNPAAEKEGKNISEWLLCQADKCTAAKEEGGSSQCAAIQDFLPRGEEPLNRLQML
jgi:hypothetical protein